MLKKYKDFFIITNILIIIVSLFLFPTLIKRQILLSLNVFITILFPTFFPMFLFTNLLIEYNTVIIISKYLKPFIEKIFHVRGECGYIILISLISGFPSGSKNIISLLEKNLITVTEANYLITFTHFSNPLFILNVVNLSLHNKLICLKILLAHFLSNFIIAYLLRPKKNTLTKEISFKKQKTNFSLSLNKSLKNTYNTLSLIMGTTIFCFLVSALIIKIFHLNNFTTIIVNGLLDLTLGTTSLKNISIPLITKSILILTFISFGSISVHLQVASILEKKVKYTNFLYGRLLGIIISIILFIIMLL